MCQRECLIGNQLLIQLKKNLQEQERSTGLGTQKRQKHRIKRQNGRIRDRMRRCKSSGRTKEGGGNERRARGGKGVLKVVVEVCFVPILVCICC